jgi:CheY-like chemotaxis protein
MQPHHLPKSSELVAVDNRISESIVTARDLQRATHRNNRYNIHMSEDRAKDDYRVLVVEDDEDAREALVALLQMKGYRAVPAGNGKEALDYLKKAPVPDLIILDLWMPVMDGWQFRNEQIRDPRLAKVPVIVVTALSDRTDIDANEIIIKPVDVDRLLIKVSQYCNRERSPAAGGGSRR